MAADRRSYMRSGVVLLALSIIPLVVTVVMWLPDRELSSGPRVEAQILEVTSVRQSSRGTPETSSLRITFTADGESVTTSVRTTRRQFGETISVTYDPENPTVVRAVQGAENRWRIPAIITGSMAGFALWMLWAALRLRLGSPSRLYRRIVWQYPNATKG